MSTPPQDDRDLLARLGYADAPLLGEGGEARVYAAGDSQVIRIMRTGATLGDALARQALLGETAAGTSALPFRTPLVHRVDEVDGRIVTFEERLAGEPLSSLLVTLTGEARLRLVGHYLDTAMRIGEIELARDGYGPLLGQEAPRWVSWSGYLGDRLRQVAGHCPDDLRVTVLREAERDWDEPDRSGLVHLDYFPANVLATNDTISAVIDFGPSAVMGDRRFDAWGAVAYLDAEISPHASDADRAQAMDWLKAHDLADGYEQAKRWIVASWAHASDDAAVMAWCRRILLG